jgi:hypothetical protein
MTSKVGRGLALPFLDRGIRKGWVVNSTPQPHFTPGKDPVPIVREAEWTPGPVWTGGKYRPTGIRSPDRPARSQLPYIANHSSTSLTCGLERETFRCDIDIDMTYLLTAVGLTNGGSSTVHIYTQTVHRTTKLTTLVGRIYGIRTQSGQTKISDELTA